jgi:NAD(P)-dependent dehydrogenase (short-subunit alcohol dehydrogenase family)
MKHLDQVAIVTGASMGIGKTICHTLADEGCHVVCAARSTAKIEQTVEEIRAKGRRSIAVTTDVADKAAVQKMADAAMAEFGQVDILVCNAGGPLAGTNFAQPESQDEFFEVMDKHTFIRIADADWKAIFDVNFYGAINCMKAVLPIMIKQDRGQILSVTSKAGKTKCDVVPGMIAYASAKAALSRFTEVLAFELMCEGSEVRVNAISPGMIASTFHSKLPAEELEAFGKPADVMASLVRILDDETGPNGENITAETFKTWHQEIRDGDKDM